MITFINEYYVVAVEKLMFLLKKYQERFRTTIDPLCLGVKYLYCNNLKGNNRATEWQ